VAATAFGGAAAG